MAAKSQEPLPAPVFVVGMNGSGTTMTVLSLGRHSRLYDFPGESQIIPRFIGKLAKYGDLADDRNYSALWEDFRRAYPFRRYNEGEPVPLPSNWRERPRTLEAVVDGVFGYFANREGKERWCEKTPMNALHIEQLAQAFPRARFIHMIRDGRDCAVSLRRRMQYAPELTMYRWKRVVREAQRQGNLVGERYMEIRYEELTAEPAFWFRRMCDFIGESFEPAIARPPDEFETGPGDPNYHIIKRGEIVSDGLRWPEALSSEEAAALERIGGSLLKELDYITGEHAADTDPYRFRRMKMAVYGYGGEAVRGVKRILGNRDVPLSRRLVMLLGRGWTQIRWWITNRTSAKH